MIHEWKPGQQLYCPNNKLTTPIPDWIKKYLKFCPFCGDALPTKNKYALTETNLHDLTNKIFDAIAKCFAVEDTIWMPNLINTTLWEHIHELLENDNMKSLSEEKLHNGNYVPLTQLYEYIGREFDYEDYKHIEEMINQGKKNFTCAHKNTEKYHAFGEIHTRCRDCGRVIE